MTAADVPPGRTGPRIRVVIVDDTASIRFMVRMALELEDDFEVLDEGVNGAEAEALAATHSPDVIILDVMMPEMTGVQATPLVKAISPLTKVLIYSSRLVDDTRAQAMRAGADAYVSKSVPMEELLDVVRALARAADEARVEHHLVCEHCANRIPLDRLVRVGNRLTALCVSCGQAMTFDSSLPLPPNR